MFSHSSTNPTFTHSTGLTIMSKSSKIPQVDSNFALQILEKQLELENKPTVKLVQDLIILYSEAIEYYEYQKNPIYFDFQGRMQKLLLRPSILSLLRHETGLPNSNIGSSFEKSRNKRAVARNKAKLASQLAAQTSEDHETIARAKMILKRQDRGTKALTSRAVSDVKSQEQELINKLKERKRVMLSPRSPPASFSFESLRDDSSQCTKDTFWIREPAIEEKLQEIMEQSFAEKAERVAEIRVKYEVQMQTLGEGKVVSEIKERMTSDMRAETERVSRAIDGARRLRIRRLKEDWDLQFESIFT